MNFNWFPKKPQCCDRVIPFGVVCFWFLVLWIRLKLNAQHRRKKCANKYFELVFEDVNALSFATQQPTLITLIKLIIFTTKNGETHGRIVSLGVTEQLLIFFSCLLPGRVRKLQKFINFCLTVGHRANSTFHLWRQISGPCCGSDIKPNQYKSLVWAKSRSATNFRHLWRCLSLKETESSLLSIINIVKIINACQDSVKHGYFLCGAIILWVKYVKMSGEQGFIAFHETVHLVKFIG